MIDRLLSGIRGRLRELNGNQSGAVALLALAAILVILLMAMVLYDTVTATSEKIHLQTATDASAYSETAIRARSMNMIAMTNVAKRMTIANVTAYINIRQWMEAIEDYSYILASICLLVTSGGCAGVASQIVSGIRRANNREVRDANKIFRKRKKRCMLKLWAPIKGTFCAARWPDWVEWAAPDYDGLGSVIDAIVSFGGRIPIRLPGIVRKFIDLVASIPDDIWKRWDPQVLIYRFYGPELRALDNYQVYMLNITPYWAWTEGVVKGFSNRAPVTVSYPSPESEPHVASLPIERAAWERQCDRANDRDKWYIFADVVLKQLGSVISGGSGGGGFPQGSLLSNAGRYGSILLSGLFMALIGKSVTQPLDLFAPRTFYETCNDITQRLLRRAGSYDINGQPHLLKRYDTEADWLMDSSSLTFGFRPNADKMADVDGARQRLGFLSNDYVAFQPRAGGTWTLSRGEIVHSSNNPNMWSADWSAHIRPVALGGGNGQVPEWEELTADDFDINVAFNEILPRVGIVTAAAHAADAAGAELITHPHNLATREGRGQILDEILAIEMATFGMSPQTMGGVSK